MKKSTLLLFYSVLFSLSVAGQSFQWAKKEGDQTNGGKITTDPAGNSYVYGRIFATTTIGGQSLDPANGDNFIVKYNGTGGFSWVKQLDSMEVSDMVSTATDLFITGRYRSGASFGGTPVTGASNWDGFIARINSLGAIVWIKTLNNGTAPSYESANSLSLDVLGNLYVTGTYNGVSMTIDANTLMGNYGLESMFLLKIIPNGSILWTKTVSSDDGAATGNIVKVAPSNDIYVMSTAFGDSLYYGTMYYYAGSYDAELLLRYDNNGNAIDMVKSNQTSQDNVTDMIVDAGSNVYTLQTNYLTSYTIAKYSPALDTTWITTDGTGGHLSVGELEIDQSGKIVVVGDVDEDATFGGSNTVYDYYGGNGFISYYTSGGTFSSLKEVPGNVFMRSSAMDASGNIYVTGTLTDSATFDAINLTTGGNEAMFIAKLGLGAAGIDSFNEESISVYPNPSTGILSCNLPALMGKAKIEVYTIAGEKVFEGQSGNGLQKIDLSGNAPGMYLLNIVTADKIFKKKIVLE